MRAAELSASHVQNILDSSREILVKIGRRGQKHRSPTNPEEGRSRVQSTNQRSPRSQNGARQGDLRIRPVRSLPYSPAPFMKETTGEDTKERVVTDSRIEEVITNTNTAANSVGVIRPPAGQLSHREPDLSTAPTIDPQDKNAQNYLNTHNSLDFSVPPVVTTTAQCSKKGGVLHMPDAGVSLIVPRDARSDPCQISVTASYQQLTSLTQFMEDQYVVSPIVTVQVSPSRYGHASFSIRQNIEYF